MVPFSGSRLRKSVFVDQILWPLRNDSPVFLILEATERATGVVLAYFRRKKPKNTLGVVGVQISRGQKTPGREPSKIRQVLFSKAETY